MTDKSADAAQLEAFLRQFGLIPADYSGEVVVKATTAKGSDDVSISV